jgi:hypothetical protein
MSKNTPINEALCEAFENVTGMAPILTEIHELFKFFEGEDISLWAIILMDAARRVNPW